jgi:hypothetical protein
MIILRSALAVVAFALLVCCQTVSIDTTTDAATMKSWPASDGRMSIVSSARPVRAAKRLDAMGATRIANSATISRDTAQESAVEDQFRDWNAIDEKLKRVTTICTGC